MASDSTKSITIYQKTYQLPVLDDTSFQQIQSQIKERQEILKTQQRVFLRQKQVQKKSFFGLRSKTETTEEKFIQVLSFEDKVYELETLVNNYEQLINFITKHKQVYLDFFAHLTSDLQQVVREKLGKAQEQENKRLELLNKETDPDLITILEEQKTEIIKSVWLFGKAFLLMVKKIDLISEGIEKITTDQDTQTKLLIEMASKLSKYKQVYELQREITQLGKEAEQLAETALNFEQYLEPFIGSFQELIEQVYKQDNSLSSTVNEIQSLVADIMSSNTGSFMSGKPDDLSKNMLDFLVTNEQKKERLVMAVEDAQRQGIDWSWQQTDVQDCGDLTQAISALQTHIDGKLESTLDEYSRIHYQSLESFLSQGKWEDADRETGELMLQVMKKLGWAFVEENDLLNFPKLDLQIMDQLWSKYSMGKFGFSVQKQIWLDCGGKVEEYNPDIYLKFAHRVGWRKEEKWLYYVELDFSIDAVQGHLPRWKYDGTVAHKLNKEGWMVFLFSLID